MKRTHISHHIIKTFLLKLLLILIFAPSPLYAYTEEKTGQTVYCRVRGAIVEKIDGSTVVIKLISPDADVYLEQYRGVPGKILLKCKNVYAAGKEEKKTSFRVKSGNAKFVWQNAGTAMLEVNLSGKREAKIALQTKFPHPDRFTFAVSGDPQGRYFIFRRFLEKIGNGNSSFLIVPGDLVDEGTEKEYGAYLKAIAGTLFPIFHIPGNHDVTRGGRGRFLDYISPVDYSFDAGKFRFIMLDSSRWYLQDYQWDWLEKELKSHRNCLVFMHVPPFCPDGSFDKYTLVWEKQDKRFTALMTKYGVKGVFSGHIHGYMKGERGGVPYYVSGGGGAYLHFYGSEGGYYHFLLIDIDGENIKVRVVKLYD